MKNQDIEDCVKELTEIVYLGNEDRYKQLIHF